MDTTFFTNIINSLSHFAWIELLASFFSLLYVIYAARENSWCWVHGFIGVVLSFIVYLNAKLYGEAILHIYYMVISVYGWFQWKGISWKKNSSDMPKTTIQIQTLPIQYNIYIVVIGTLLSFLLAFLLAKMGSAMPKIDAAIMVFSIINTQLTTQKYLENWLYWIIIDVVCVFLYFQRELNFFLVLSAIYAVISVVGYIKWRKKWQLSLQA